MVNFHSPEASEVYLKLFIFACVASTCGNPSPRRDKQEHVDTGQGFTWTADGFQAPAINSFSFQDK